MAKTIDDVVDELVTSRREPLRVLFTVPVPTSTARALLNYCADEDVQPETIIAEALRAYLGAM